MKKIFPFGFIVIVVFIFFWQFLIKGLLPIPSDTIVGLYNPFRDLYTKDYPRGIPFKNFLITDPVRQQYPWKNLVVEAEKNLTLPLWNPYNFAGTPLLANFQSGSFYPLNILFFVMPFNIAWSFLIFLSPLLAGIFLYLYLSNLKLSKSAAVFGALIFSFSGFSVSWLEWGVIFHTALWLPLMLFSIDKIYETRKNISLWNAVLVISLSASLFSGHLQIFFYLFIISVAYFIIGLFKEKNSKKKLFLFGSFLAFGVITSLQWIPTLQFIFLSARSVDVLNWNTQGWFIPWQNLVQFVAPDFLGNPATLNYYGIWNYGEFVGYIGIIPLIFAFFALFFKKERRIFFFGSVFFLSLLFALPTFLAKIPFQLNIPIVNTAQPTRLLFLIDFSLSILAAFGLDHFIKNKKKLIYPTVFMLLIFAELWNFVLYKNNNMFHIVSSENIAVSQKNLILPTILIATWTILLLISLFFHKNRIIGKAVILIVILITAFDLESIPESES